VVASQLAYAYRLEIKQAAVETMERLERGIPPDMEWSSRDAWSL
jgi:hypothetical protein